MANQVKPGKRFPFLRSVLGPLLVGYVILVALVYLVQRRMMYFPMASAVPLPGESRFAGLEEVELQTSDGLRLKAWHWPGSRPATLVIFNGNAGNRRHRLEWIEDFHRLGLGVFILDYRGYGGSQGSPSEEGLYRDGEAALAWLREQGMTNLVYLGESIGTGVAVEMARRHPPAALILQSTFSSAVDVAARAYFFLPVRWLLRDRFENRAKISQVKAPVLFIHGEQDTIISPQLGRALFEAASEPKEWYAVPGAGHNDVPWTGGREYLEKIDAFVRRHAPGSR